VISTHAGAAAAVAAVVGDRDDHDIIIITGEAYYIPGTPNASGSTIPSVPTTVVQPTPTPASEAVIITPSDTTLLAPSITIPRHHADAATSRLATLAEGLVR
jgi:hypothetical protein